MLKVGISARFMAHSSADFGMGGKSIQYLEQSLSNSVAREGGLVFMIPAVGTRTELSSEHFRPEMYAQELDGLVLQGGVDICPQNYGEDPLPTTKPGDLIRDQYELALIDAFFKAKKPVLGICRGMQLINVYLGGTLWQDIPTQIGSPIGHLCEEARENVCHDVEIFAGTSLARIYSPGRHRVNSIHHQCVKALGQGLKAEAYSPEDGIVEAIRHDGDSYLVGLQWHPEFHYLQKELACGKAFFADYMREVAYAKSAPRSVQIAAGF